MMKIKYTDELSHSYYIGPGPGNRWREKNGQFGHDPDPNYGNTITPGHHDIKDDNHYYKYATRSDHTSSGHNYQTSSVPKEWTYKNVNTSSGHHDAPNAINNQVITREQNNASSNVHNPNYNTNWQNTQNSSSQTINPSIDLKGVKTLAVASSSAGKEIARTADIFMKPKQGKRLDVSNMSDDDLRAILNRERMEREYNNYFNPPTVNKGAEVVKGIGNFISTSGTIALTALQAVEVIKGFTGH